MQVWRHHRDLIEQDLHATYGIDVDLADPLTQKVLRRRDWRWFLIRFRGLLNDPTTRLYLALSPPPPPPPKV